MIGLILILGLALRLIALNQSFWLDEAAQAVLSRAPVLSVNYAADFQPPLYYVLSHFWMTLGTHLGIGHQEWFLRLPSVIFGLLTIYLVYIFCSKIMNKPIALLASFFLAISPFHIYYSQEFRMYSLLTLLCLASWIALSHKKWLIVSVLIALSVFTHYFAFVNIVALLVYVVVGERKELKKTLLHVGLGLLPFVLWLPIFFKQVESAHQLVTVWPSWKAVSNPGFIKFLPLTFAKWTVGMIRPDSVIYAGAIAVFGIISGIALGIILKKKTGKTQKTTQLLAIYCFAPLLLAWLGSIWLPAASPARVQFVLPAFYMLLSYGLYKLSQQKQFHSIGQVCIITVALMQLYFSGSYLLDEKNHREDWRGAIQFSDAVIAQEKAVAITEFDQKWVPMDWYSKAPQKYQGGSSNPFVTDQSPMILDQYISKTTPLIVYTYLFQIADPNKLLESYLTVHGYKIVKEKDFRGVGIVKIYR